MNPGIYDNISIRDYHDGDGISKSGLDKIRRSQAYYYDTTISPSRPPEKERAGQLEGNVAHCAILEPDEFDKRYIVIPKDAPDRPTEKMIKAKNPSDNSIIRQEWWSAFESQIKGRTPITNELYTTSMFQSESVRRNPQIREYFSSGVAEQSAYWIDPETGILCRCRPDFVHDTGGSNILLDVKTFSIANEREFSLQVGRKRYNIQDAFYGDGYAHASGKPTDRFIFVVVESDYPYHSMAIELDDYSRKLSRIEYRKDLISYKAAFESGEWNYPDQSGILMGTLSNWEISRIEAENDLDIVIT